MARSSYIYIVAAADYDGDHILAAFTVKHECASWLKRHPLESEMQLSREVIRVPDGRLGLGEDRWTEADFLAANA